MPFALILLLALVSLLKLLLILLSILLLVITRLLLLLLWLWGNSLRRGQGLLNRLLVSKCLNIIAILLTVFHFAD